MAVKISITEILTGAASKKTVAEKVDFLRSNDSTPLRVVLKYTYDKSTDASMAASTGGGSGGGSGPLGHLRQLFLTKASASIS